MFERIKRHNEAGYKRWSSCVSAGAAYETDEPHLIVEGCKNDRVIQRIRPRAKDISVVSVNLDRCIGCAFYKKTN